MMIHPDALIASDYVVCATLRKVADVFNVELLWGRGRGGQEGICLLEALRRCPRVPQTRQRQEIRYSQVIVRIPERDYLRDDRLEDGFGRRALLQDLSRLHQQELSDYLARDAVVNYRLEADSGLRAGEVQFLFGRAIHIPDEGEMPLFQAQATDEKHDEWRNLGLIYSGQRLTLLNGDRRTSSFRVAGWPFASGESVLLMLRSASPRQVDVVAEPPGCLTLSEEGAGGFVARDRRGRGLRLRIVALAANEEPPAMLGFSRDSLEPALQSVEESATAPATDSFLPPPEFKPPNLPLNQEQLGMDPWGRREPVLDLAIDFDDLLVFPALGRWPTPPLSLKPAPAPQPSAPAPLQSPALPAPGSAMDQPTWIPQWPTACLQVVGVALQRLSTYAAAGISDWRLGFNRAGGLVPDGHPDAAAWLRIDSADRVFGEVAALSAPLEVPRIWCPFLGMELGLYAVPGAMATHYLGWVQLPAPLELPVPREREVSFGRGSEADIAPRLLADPRALRWEGGPAQTVGISAEYLGLSRRHLSLHLRRTGWWVRLESQNMPAYRLSSSGELLNVLTPGANAATDARPGELLVAGGYVLMLGAVE